MSDRATDVTLRYQAPGDVLAAAALSGNPQLELDVIKPRPGVGESGNLAVRNPAAYANDHGCKQLWLAVGMRVVSINKNLLYSRRFLHLWPCSGAWLRLFWYLPSCPSACLVCVGIKKADGCRLCKHHPALSQETLKVYLTCLLMRLVISNIVTWSLPKMGLSLASALMLRRLAGSCRSCFLM